MSAVRSDWGADFWERFYGDPSTRICTTHDLYAEGLWLGLTIVSRLGVPIRSALDFGSGTGDFANGLENSLGFKTRRFDPHSPDSRADVIDNGNRAFDLIVCRDVLQYIEKPADAAKLLLGFNQSGAKALYIRVPVMGDRFTEESDQEITLRPASWYRAMLSNYAQYSFGLFIKGGVQVNSGVFE